MTQQQQTNNNSQSTQQQDNLSQYNDQSAPVEAGRARIIYDTAVDDVDDDLGVLEDEPELQAEDLGDLDTLAGELLPEEEEEEPEDDFVEGSPRFELFKQDFSKAFGLELNEAVELVQQLNNDKAQRAANEQKYELSAHWEVPVAQVEERLATVAKLWLKLPADKRSQFDNPQGAIALWSRHEQAQAKRGQGFKSTTKTGNVNGGSTRTAYDYTQKQIDNMDAEAYAVNAERIAVAYANKRVKR